MSKPKVGFYWCASCGGCEEAVVDLAEDILDVVNMVQIAFWPVALDFKRSDLEGMADNELAVGFINGAVRTTEQLEMVELMRRKCGTIVAFGSCAHMGGIPGLANLTDRRGIMEEAYVRTPSTVNPEKLYPSLEFTAPEGKLTLPELWDNVKSLDQVIDVEYYLPGCPPPTALIKDAVVAIVEGKLPPIGTVLAPDITLCEECPLTSTKPEKPALRKFSRPHEIEVDSETCLLAQGLLCLGPATRKGCGAACVKANMPCTGCMGPTSRVVDYGAKALSAISSLIDSNDEAEIRDIVNQIVDPVGTFYRYSLPASALHRRIMTTTDGGSNDG